MFWAKRALFLLAAILAAAEAAHFAAISLSPSGSDDRRHPSGHPKWPDHLPGIRPALHQSSQGL